MNRSSTGMMVLFVLIGLLCGLALSVLIQPGGVSAQAPVPTAPAPSGGGAVLAGQAPSGQVQVANPAGPQATTALASKAFTYQGMLRLGGQPVNASCDFQFSAFDALTAGTQLGATQSLTGSVANGLFTVQLNDAGQFGLQALDGRAVWIETALRCPGGSGSYTTLAPRQALTAAPLAAGLVPHTTLQAGDTYSGNAALTIHAPAGAFGNPMGLQVQADPSNVIGNFNPIGVWGDSGTGLGVWGTTSTGSAISGYSSGSGLAGNFQGDVTISGKLNSRLKVTQVINVRGALPVLNAPFSTSGGTLVLFFSGSGYAPTNGVFIGMNVLIDGNLVDSTGIYANTGLTHLAFVPKGWVVANIGSGAHTLSLTAFNVNTLSDSNDIFTVAVLEMPN